MKSLFEFTGPQGSVAVVQNPTTGELGITTKRHNRSGILQGVGTVWLPSVHIPAFILALEQLDDDEPEEPEA